MTTAKRILLILSFTILGINVILPGMNTTGNTNTGTDSKPLFLLPSEVSMARQHTSHEKIFGKYAPAFNKYILKAIDKIQARTREDGYYTNKKDKSQESPLGYELKIFNRPLLKPPRNSSFCTGATYAALIEALNLIFPHGEAKLTLPRYEALRMQEPDGSVRQDFVKVWGHWNTQWGSCCVLQKYLNIGIPVTQQEARPGDFINILRKTGRGHAAIFLGWYKSYKGKNYIMYWSSQSQTNGISDHMIPVNKIARIAIFRLTWPKNIFNFTPSQNIPCQENQLGTSLETFLLNE